MSTVITGATGFVGSELLKQIDQPVILSRNAERARQKFADTTVKAYDWDSNAEPPPAEAFEGADAVIHLAGESVGEGRWTAGKKQRIRDSRVRGTRHLVDRLETLETKPKVLVSASAVGYYGGRGDEILNETAGTGNDYLANVCQGWEAEANRARDFGIRVINVRIGIVLGPGGGALKKMLPPFRMGAGGRLGNGRQMMSWIAIDDLIYAMLHALENESISGPVNAVSPGAVNNAEFTHELGTVLRRPTLFPMPATAARLAFGELADALLLSSQHVVPTRLLESGFEFRYPHLEDALRHVLGQKKAAS